MSWVQPKFSDYVIRPVKKQKTDTGSIRKLKNSDTNLDEISWLNKWKPNKRSDLVVHKKKIDEIEKWLEETKLNKSGASLLLLYGPTGCGKFTTLKVLCNECGINLIEWIPQVALSNYEPDSNSFVPYQSEISLFEEFITRATRYSNVLNRNSSRLIVVKDIPLKFTKDPYLFHEFLSKYSNVNGVNLVFIVTEFKITRELFSDDIKNKFNIKTIQFNPVTQKNTVNALQRIAKGKYSKHLESISVSCEGDLRNAITTLQFLAVKGTLPEKKQEQSNDKSLDIFHGIGRVLYAKREDNGKLKHCPLDLAESFTSSPDLFINMLHENYLATFSSIHDISNASQCLTTSDLLLKPIDSSIFSIISLSITSNGLMSYNSKPIKKFQQFNRPTRVNNNLSEFKAISKDSESLIDITCYGRYIPQFSSTHKELYQKVKPFGKNFM